MGKSDKLVPIEALHDVRRQALKLRAENESLKAERTKSQADLSALLAFLGHLGFSISAAYARIKSGD
jgi:FtsZ-binding cell division protein ZapB